MTVKRRWVEFFLNARFATVDNFAYSHWQFSKDGGVLTLKIVFASAIDHSLPSYFGLKFLGTLQSY